MVARPRLWPGPPDGPAGLAAAVYASSEGLNHGRPGAVRAGRAGGHERSHRELPTRVSNGPFRRGPDEKGDIADAQIRRRHLERSRGHWFFRVESAQAPH